MFVFKTRKFQFKLVGIDVQFFTADVFLYFKFKICADMLPITRILIQASFSLVVLFLSRRRMYILQDLKNVQID